MATWENVGRIKGDTGEGLDYHWNGTELGVKKESETNYTYVDLTAKNTVVNNDVIVNLHEDIQMVIDPIIVRNDNIIHVTMGFRPTETIPKNEILFELDSSYLDDNEIYYAVKHCTVSSVFDRDYTVLVNGNTFMSSTEFKQTTAILMLDFSTVLTEVEE